MKRVSNEHTWSLGGISDELAGNKNSSSDGVKKSQRDSHDFSPNQIEILNSIRQSAVNSGTTSSGTSATKMGNKQSDEVFEPECSESPENLVLPDKKEMPEHEVGKALLTEAEPLTEFDMWFKSNVVNPLAGLPEDSGLPGHSVKSHTSDISNPLLGISNEVTIPAPPPPPPSGFLPTFEPPPTRAKRSSSFKAKKGQDSGANKRKTNPLEVGLLKQIESVQDHNFVDFLKTNWPENDITNKQRSIFLCLIGLRNHRWTRGG